MRRASRTPGVCQEFSYNRRPNRATARITVVPRTARHSPSAASGLVGAQAGQSAMLDIPMPTGKAASSSNSTRRTMNARLTLATLPRRRRAYAAAARFPRGCCFLLGLEPLRIALDWPRVFRHCRTVAPGGDDELESWLGDGAPGRPRSRASARRDHVVVVEDQRSSSCKASTSLISAGRSRDPPASNPEARTSVDGKTRVPDRVWFLPVALRDRVCKAGVSELADGGCPSGGFLCGDRGGSVSK
jgi:hypothetical protein